MEAEDMRVEPIGKDNAGRHYFYFTGNRLYREAVEESTKPKGVKRKKSAQSDFRFAVEKHDIPSLFILLTRAIEAFDVVCRGIEDWKKLCEELECAGEVCGK